MMSMLQRKVVDTGLQKVVSTIMQEHDLNMAKTAKEAVNLYSTLLESTEDLLY